MNKQEMIQACNDDPTYIFTLIKHGEREVILSDKLLQKNKAIRFQRGERIGAHNILLIFRH